MKYGDLRSRLMSEPLMMEPNRLLQLVAHVESHGMDDDIDPDELNDVFGAVRPRANQTGSLAVVPLHGFIQQKEDIWSQMGFATSAERFVANVGAMLADGTVKAVVIDVDSPGGTVSGVPEAAAALYGMRGNKPMIAVSNSLNASAAYYLSSAADEVVSPPTGQTGSIGVWMAHMDMSGALEQMGVNVSLIKAGKYKVEANPFEALSDDAREHLQEVVDDAYSMFVRDVAKHRGVTPAAVRSGYGEGRVLDGEKAKAAGLVDRVATFGDTIARHGGTAQRSVRAAIERDRLALAE